MESPPSPLVSYNSPDDSPATFGQVTHNESPQPSSDVSREHGELPSTTDDIRSDAFEDSEGQRQSLEDTVNPSLPFELDEAECALLRGDAIGSTTYTHRWILNTLLTITQALPQYLRNEKTTEDITSKCPETSSHNFRMGNTEEELPGIVETEKADSILELAEDVENAACQLWDMTAEPDVVYYLLSLDVMDILQLAKDIITQSRAPRLTEVVVGVVANLCCQSDGCKKVIGHQSLLNSCLTLLHTTDDVPTLVEAFRLLRLLFWHLTNRVAPQDRSQCPLILALKSHEFLKEELVFILKNSLSEPLLSALSEFLEIFMYIWFPNDLLYMAAHYSESGLVEGVVEMMRFFLKQWEKSGGQELPKPVHQGVLILYSFVATPAAHIISSFDHYESLLEPILVAYVEHLAKVESIEELLEEDNVQRLTCALGLCELLVPTMRHSNILLPVVKLMAFTHGASYHYTAVKCQIFQEAHKKAKAGNQIPKEHQRRFSRSRSRSRRRSSQGGEMETDIPVLMEKQREPKQNEAGSNVVEKERDHKEEPSEVRCHGSLTGNCESTSLKSDVCTDIENDGNNCIDSISLSSTDDLGCQDYSTKLKTIVGSLIDYCIRVVRCCPDLWAVLTALNECHVHEVQLFFRAMRCREPKLVGQLQEQLLDSGSHNRLVTILSDMYT
ncbi:uncharacterized protein [Panulirus ornatus]|uniref:uncharacterized protein n=1 Tax=Panulirus ornatus TaxID=150431 RepID=UPI003A8C6868